MVKRKSNYLPWIIIIILILIILYIINNGFKTKTDTSPSNTSPSDIAQLTDKCTKAFNDCMDIGRERGYSIKLENKDYTYNFNEANTFYRHWRGSQQAAYLSSELNKTGESLSFPVTLFVVESKYGTSAPSDTRAVICNSDGTLLKVTSSWACGD